MIRKRIYPLLFVFNILICFSACSVPNLEQPECTESRDVVKEFYSTHFGNDMKPSADYLKLRKSFITESLYSVVSKQSNDSYDAFTLTNDYAKAFRIGGCKVIDANKTSVEILLFWKSDARSEQKAIHAETVKENGKWLINKVEN